MTCVRDWPPLSLVWPFPCADARRDPATRHPANSFEFQVHCGDRSGAIVGVFGKEGDGPGEFRTPTDVERGPDGTIAVIDLRLDRLTFFSTDGTYESTVSMPGAFSPDGLWGTRVFGADHFKNVDFSDLSTGSPEDMLRPAHMEIDFVSGEVVWERSGITEAADIECGPVFLGRPDPRGGYVFRACQELLVFFEHRDDTAATVVASPTYVEELPNQRDVDEYQDPGPSHRLRPLRVDLRRPG